MNAAHWHLVLNHLPVVGSLFTLLLLGWALLRHSDELQRTALGAVVLVMLTCFPAYFTGESAAEVAEKIPGVNKQLFEPHEEAAAKAFTVLFIAGLVSLTALIWKRRVPLPNWICILVFVLLLATCGLMGWSANLGGKIRHPEISAHAD